MDEKCKGKRGTQCDDTDDGKIEIVEEKGQNLSRKRAHEYNKKNSIPAAATVSQRQKHGHYENTLGQFTDKELPAVMDKGHKLTTKGKTSDTRHLDSEAPNSPIDSTVLVSTSAVPATSSLAAIYSTVTSNVLTSFGHFKDSIGIAGAGKVSADSFVCSPREYEILKVHETNFETMKTIIMMMMKNIMKHKH